MNPEYETKFALIEARLAQTDVDLAKLKRQAKREQTDGSTALQPFSVTPEQLAPVPSLSLQKTSAQTLLDNSVTDLTYQSTVYANIVAAALPVTIVTLPVAGLWLATLYAHFDASTAGDRFARIYIGSEYNQDHGSAAQTAGIGWSGAPSHVARVAAGAQVKASAWQNSGGSLNVLESRLTVTWLGN